MNVLFRSALAAQESMHCVRRRSKRKYYLEHILLSWSDAERQFMYKKKEGQENNDEQK
jgi:hypothetical protein